MNISKEQWTRIISIVLGAALAIAAVLGWVLPITPMGTTVGGMQTLGADKVKSLNVSSNLTVGGDATVGGSLTVVGTVYSTTEAVLAEVGDGTVSLPAYTFGSDPDSGVYVIGANNLGVGVSGAKVLDVSTTGLGVVGITKLGNGTAAAPALAFTSDAHTGLYRVGDHDIGVTTNGVLALDVSATAISAALPVYLPAGAVTAPELTWTGDVDSGLYRIAANNLGVAVNGAKVLDVGVGGLGVVGVAKSGDGTVSLPSYSYTSDPDSGSYIIGANNVGVAVNATKILDVGTTGLGVVGVVKNGNGTVSLPAYSFTGDPDTGLYSIGVNNIGIATNGVKAFDVSATAINASLPIVGTTATFTTITADNLISSSVGFSATATSTLVDVTARNITTTGVIAIGDGLVTAPGLAFSSDTNTGLYSVGANDIGIATNGVIAMDISASAVTLALPLTSNGDVTFGVANTTASIAPATQATGTNGNAVTLTGGQAGAAATGAAGKNGGSVTITGGLGTDKEGAGTPSGDGGDVVLVGGAKGGTTSNVTGIVRVGAPSVQTAKTTNLLAVGGALEVDGATQLDGGLGVVGVAKLGDGTVSLPGYSFTSDPDSGAYMIGANNLGVAVNATKILDVGVGGLGVVGVTTIGDGAVTAPGLAFTSDTNTGLYSIGANNIGIATNGVIAMDASASAITFGLPVKGPAEGSGIYNLLVDATAAEIKAGHVLVTVPAARVFRLVDVTAVAYGATCTTSTVMSLTATSDLVVYTTANLVRSTTLRTTTTGVALLADGASFAAQAAGADLSVKDDTADTAGCTGVRFVITYALD